MKNLFFESALLSARQGPEAFLAEFKKIDADANATESYSQYGRHGDPLIHSIIQIIPDEKLPPLLDILIQHGVNLESENPCKETPLSVAAGCNKIAAVKFLIDHHVAINQSGEPALCSAINDDSGDHQNERINLDIVITLLKHGANINIQDVLSRSALFRAAEECSLEVTRYLLAQGADMFLKYTYYGKRQHKTAFCEAYNSYIIARQHSSHAETQRAKECLELHIQAIINYLNREGLKQPNVELFIANTIQDLSGNFKSVYPESNSNLVKEFLAARIRSEKIHSFCMGSRLSKTQREQKTIPPIYRFFAKDGAKDLRREIFSFYNLKKK